MTSPSARTSLAPALVGAVSVGVLTAVQARINGQLGVRLEHAMVAAVISFGSGLLLIALVSVLTPGGRRGAVLLSRGIRERSIPWWMLVGGAAGALTVGTQAVAVGIVGVSLFTVGIVAGQTVGGLILDRVGYGPGGVVAVTVPRLVGGALALAAVGVVLISGDGLAGVPVWMVVLPVVVGVGLAWQQATNGRLRVRVGTPVTATLVNFTLGTAILAMLAVVVTIVDGPPAALPSEPWLYLGGALGVAYVMLSAALVARTGVLLFGLAAVSGQLLASLALDVLWPAPAGPGVVIEAVTVVIGLASVFVAAFWPVRR
ncbi:DMT family transporter [Microbacterium sp. KSW4-11]|uniref:DMT family transporter n=1 Tax=Microbacterium gawkjiense TaxID=3067309 RepID=A0ABU3GD58_9MICO|nr:DMT family transporter [Microbacterium sp. KSW4-11]MDT3317744.1 DMT family transporter [Microbacterium sp. KSW4-11]